MLTLFDDFVSQSAFVQNREIVYNWYRAVLGRISSNQYAIPSPKCQYCRVIYKTDSINRELHAQCIKRPTSRATEGTDKSKMRRRGCCPPVGEVTTLPMHPTTDQVCSHHVAQKGVATGPRVHSTTSRRQARHQHSPRASSNGSPNHCSKPGPDPRQRGPNH